MVHDDAGGNEGDGDGRRFGWFDEELTWVGAERADELSVAPVVETRAGPTGPPPYGLHTLLTVIGFVGTLALVGVAAGWFDAEFAREIVIITLTPAGAAWLVGLACTRGGRGDD